MKQTKQILLAFLIPFSLAVALVVLEDYFFPKCFWTEIQEETVCIEKFGTFSLFGIAYGLLGIGSFLTSLFLPSFITGRAYKNRKNQLSAKLIIE